MSWFRVVPNKSGAVTIGRYKEQLVREVAFPLPPLGEGGHYQAKLQRPHDETPYPLASRVEGQELIWLVSLADTSDPGEGLVEIRWDGPNGETWKSPQYAVRIAKGLADPKEAPEAWAGFMQQVNRDAGRAETAASTATQAAQAANDAAASATEAARSAESSAGQAGLSADNAAKTLKKLEDGIASGDFRGEKGEKGDKGDPGSEADPAAVQKIVDDYLKANPPQAGSDGKDGITPTIGKNGNWYLGDTDTGKPSRGAAGAKGADGADGKDGAKGDKGDKGDPGDKGAPGATGSQGKPGERGPQGETGPQGPAGETGPKGDPGADGAQGIQGPAGPQGEKGDTGPAGPTGATGPKGEKGATGATGPQGPKGDPGSDATVTADSIKTALGYTPVKPGDIVTETTQVLPAYTNQIPLSTDASGAMLNGVGYQSGVLDMSGAVATGSSFVSGFIPVNKGDVIRVKDPSSTSFSTGLVFALYKSDKATGSNIGRYINTMQENSLYGAVSISGNVLTWDTSSIGYYFWNDFAYLRITTYSADSIVTINQAIVETTQTVMTLNPAVKVGQENLNFAIGMRLLSGRKVVVFGDSIIGMTRDQTSVPAYAAAYTGAEVYNVGFGGCRMAVHPTSGYAAFSMWALADAVASGSYTLQDAQASNGSDYFPEQLALLKTINFSGVDMMVIHYGTNDFAANVPVDNASDDDDTATLCGALRYSLRKLMTAFPKIRIFVSVPIYRKWGSTGAETYTNASGKKLRDFCEALAGVAAEFNLPVIDGYKALGINTINDAAFSADGTHLNAHGRRAFGELVGGKLISPI